MVDINEAKLEARYGITVNGGQGEQPYASHRLRSGRQPTEPSSCCVRRRTVGSYEADVVNPLMASFLIFFLAYHRFCVPREERA
jgi:hypothetical protein